MQGGGTDLMDEQRKKFLGAHPTCQWVGVLPLKSRGQVQSLSFSQASGPSCSQGLEMGVIDRLAFGGQQLSLSSESPLLLL